MVCGILIIIPLDHQSGDFLLILSLIMDDLDGVGPVVTKKASTCGIDGCILKARLTHNRLTILPSPYALPFLTQDRHTGLCRFSTEVSDTRMVRGTTAIASKASLSLASTIRLPRSPPPPARWCC